MRRAVAPVLGVFFLGASARAAEAPGSTDAEAAAPAPVTAPPPPEILTIEIVRSNLEASYITFPIILSGVDPLIFETNIVPHFFLTPHDWPVAVALTPKVLLGIFQGPSTPVKTPSYMPQLTVFGWFERTFTGKPLFYSSLSLNHHSNGQSGPFTNPDGSNNHETGSFATNYFELSVHRAGWKPALFDNTSLSFEWHPGIADELGPDGRYSKLRLHVGTTLLVHLIVDAKFTARLSAFLDDFATSSDSGFVRAIERFPLQLQYIAKLPKVDVGLYVGYYFGHDYYNIWFDRLANMFQIGIGADVSSSVPAALH